MKLRGICFVFALCLGLAAQARSQMAAENAPLVLGVGCGVPGGPLCTRVVPIITGRTGLMGILLKPMPGGNDDAAAVCTGRLAAAFVPRDAIPRDCFGHADLIGPPLFPYYALLLVLAAAPFRQFDDLAVDGRRVLLAPAEDPALGDLMAARPSLRERITISRDGDPRQLADGTADALFARVALDSPLFARGTGLFRFADIYPGADLFRLADPWGHCIYRALALDFGGGRPGGPPITTISSDGVLLLARGVRDAHAKGGPRAMDALIRAVEDLRRGILADMKSPLDWASPVRMCGAPGVEKGTER